MRKNPVKTRVCIFSITTIIFFNELFADFPSKKTNLPDIFLSVIKFGLDNKIEETKKSLFETIRYGNFT